MTFRGRHKPDDKQDPHLNHWCTLSHSLRRKRMAQVRGVHLIQLETPDEHSKIPMDGVRETMAVSTHNTLPWQKGSHSVRTSQPHHCWRLWVVRKSSSILPTILDLKPKDTLKNLVWHLVKQKSRLWKWVHLFRWWQMEEPKYIRSTRYTRHRSKWGEPHLRHGIGRARLRRV